MRTKEESRIESIATESGIYQFGYVDLDRLKYSDDVRKICEGNSCRNYGRSWACPPAVGTLEECRARMEQYRKMLLFTKKYDVESSFDFEAMAEGLQDFQRTVDTFYHGLEPVLSGFLLLSNEGCARCAKCTYPDEPCRFPNLLHHSLEGYGFVVNELAAEAGIKYNNSRTLLQALLQYRLLSQYHLKPYSRLPDKTHQTSVISSHRYAREKPFSAISE